MKVESPNRFFVGPPGAQVPLVCPETRRPLYQQDGEAVCYDQPGKVLRSWRKKNGFWDFVVGERFEDVSDEACRSYEVESNTYSAQFYWSPLFQGLFPDYAQRKYRLLAIGCGIGVEVDFLCQQGFACFGVDNGNRTVDWTNRRHPEGLLHANGRFLPFADGTFDAVFCGCVFPHVGVMGDTHQVSAQCQAHRQQLAGEMVRVTRQGGQVIACSPNRWFLFDIFHGRKPGSYHPRFNPPWSRFMLSVADYREMFRQAGGRDLKTLPVEGFWGFVTMRRSVKGRLLSLPIRLAFRIASLPAFACLRPSPFVPWIAVRCQA